MQGTAPCYILEQNLDFGGFMFGLLWARRLVWKSLIISRQSVVAICKSH